MTLTYFSYHFYVIFYLTIVMNLHDGRPHSDACTVMDKLEQLASEMKTFDIE